MIGHALKLKGRFAKVQLFDRLGNLKTEFAVDNGICNLGKNSILDTFFNGATQVTSTNWSIGLVDGSGTPSLASGDTLASHAGWTENTSYSGNRQAWTQGSAASQAVTNATPATFNITANGTLYGIFICGAATGTSAILWSTAAFTTPVPVSNGDQMKVTYTLAT